MFSCGELIMVDDDTKTNLKTGSSNRAAHSVSGIDQLERNYLSAMRSFLLKYDKDPNGVNKHAIDGFIAVREGYMQLFGDGDEDNADYDD